MKKKFKASIAYEIINHKDDAQSCILVDFNVR